MPTSPCLLRQPLRLGGGRSRAPASARTTEALASGIGRIAHDPARAPGGEPPHAGDADPTNSLAPTTAGDRSTACVHAAAKPRRLPILLRGALAVGAWLFAVAVVGHTLAFLAQHRPALPVYDGWAPWSDIDAILHGRTTPLRALFGRHNEHRVLLVRLLFIVDLLDGGRDRVGVAASLAAQASQAALWLLLLRRAGVDRPTRWLVGGAVVALLFTLRQGDNFMSGFQAQFTGVFALDVAVAFLLLPRSADPAKIPCPRHLMAGAAGLLLLPFTMANGLLAGPACAVAALAARSRAGRRIACVAVALTAVSVVVDRSLPAGSGPSAALAFTPAAALHALAYIGGTVTSGRVPWAVAAGIVGVASSAAIALAVIRTGARSRAEAVAVEALLFTLASAGATAAGRIGAGFGVEQALSGRYATGSASFWSATLVFWAARLASLPPGRSRWNGTAALTLLTAALLGFVARDQHSYDRTLARQGAAAERVLAASERGDEPAPADLADIGIDARTARADAALILQVRTFADPNARRSAAE